MAADVQSSPFIKHLASSDKETRDQALESLKNFLSGRKEIPELDLLKLWKGLFCCLWMQDKPANQQRLSRDLASIPSILQPSVTLPFLRAFWLTIAREWQQIEALRMDKYLFLIRQYVYSSFKFLSRGSKGWAGHLAEIEEHGRILAETPLNPTDLKIPNGLRYHVLDVYVDELEKVGGEKKDGEWDAEVLEKLFEPIVKLSKEGKMKAVRVAAKECIDDERARAWRGEKDESENEDEDMEDEEWGGIEDD